MSAYPPTAELVAIQDELQAIHKKMHEYANQYPRSEQDFISVAVKVTDSVWKLDKMIETAEHIDRVEKRK